MGCCASSADDPVKEQRRPSPPGPPDVNPEASVMLRGSTDTDVAAVAAAEPTKKRKKVLSEKTTKKTKKGKKVKTKKQRPESETSPRALDDGEPSDEGSTAAGNPLSSSITADDIASTDFGEYIDSSGADDDEDRSGTPTQRRETLGP